ncbi:MAG: hypothetical protein SGILL_006978, partial [Bacillariaceae sp.]
IVDVKRDIPLNRLPTLIQQAMKWQSHTGQLPWIKEVYNEETGESAASKERQKKKKGRKRKRYNLVMGEVAGGDRNTMVGDEMLQLDDDDEDREAIPRDVLAKVKFGKSAVCESAVFSSKGLITGSSDSMIEIWDSTDFKELNTTDYPYQKENAMGHNDSPVLCMDLSNDGEILVSGDSDGKVKVWKLASGKCLRQYQAHDVSVTALSLSRDASKVLTGSASGICREFGLVSSNVVQVFEGHTSYINSCRYVLGWKFANDKSPQTGVAELWVVTASADGTVRLWQKGSAIRVLQPPRDLSLVNRNFSLTVDPTALMSESPGIHTAAPVPGDESRILVVPRSSEAFLVDLEGSVLQCFRTGFPETVFVSATVTANVAYLVTAPKGDCLVFSLRNGKLLKTITNFSTSSVTKTNTEHRIAEISSIVHHPFKPSILASFSNDKTQKKGILAVWK